MLRTTFFVVLVVFTSAVSSAQTPRPSHLNAEFHRAETAWMSGGSLLEAKVRVDKVLKSIPDDTEALKLRAKVLLALGRLDGAFEDALAAVKLDGTDGEAHLILCETARLTGNNELARSSLDLAAESLIDNAQAHIHLSREAVHLELLDRAEAFARISLALSPSDPAAHYQLARVFVAKGQPNGAVTVLTKGLQSGYLSRDGILTDPILADVAADL